MSDAPYRIPAPPLEVAIRTRMGEVLERGEEPMRVLVATLDALPLSSVRADAEWSA